MEKESNSSAIDYGDGSFPNIEKLAALLNQQKHPRRMLQAIIALCAVKHARDDAPRSC